MRSSRLVALVLLLQAREGRSTAPALAADLEVSVRTVYRDVAALQAAGVPLWTVPGPGGGIRLVEGWRTRLDGLTGDEAGALLLSGAPSAAAELGLGAVLVAAQAKVLATLPPELRARAARVQERLHVDAPGWFHRDEPLPHLATVADAVWAARRLDLRYGRPGREVHRRVDPLGLVVKAGTWYLVAGTRRGVATYRVGRVRAATILDEPAERPAGFRLAEWWATSSSDFDRSLQRERVRLRVAPWAERRLAEAVGATAAQDARATATPPDGDGWRELEVGVESVEVATAQLTVLGGGVEVLAPIGLRRALAAVGASMAARNAVADDEPGASDGSGRIRPPASSEPVSTTSSGGTAP